jgi:hypothetical protein
MLVHHFNLGSPSFKRQYITYSGGTNDFINEAAAESVLCSNIPFNIIQTNGSQKLYRS